MSPVATRKLSHAKTDSKAKSPPKKAGASLPKTTKGKKPSGKDAKKKGKTVPELHVVAFRKEFTMEAYMFCMNDGNDHYNGFRKYANGESTYVRLDELGFGDVKYRRYPGTRSQIYTNDGNNNFWRVIFMRYLEEPSTTASHTEGLNAVKEFLMSTASSKWPPKEIATKDITNEADPHPLDAFFLDTDIEKFMKSYLDEDQFGEQFYETYGNFAQKCWSGPHDSKFANELGFPNNS